MVRTGLVGLLVLLLSGCPAIPLIARMTHDGKAEFEGWVNGKIGKSYLEACYWRGEYNPSRSLCGPPVETREVPPDVEHVHRAKYKCVYAFKAEKGNGLIRSWRYISEPEECWVYFPTA